MTFGAGRAGAHAAVDAVVTAATAANHHKRVRWGPPGTAPLPGSGGQAGPGTRQPPARVQSESEPPEPDPDPGPDPPLPGPLPGRPNSPLNSDAPAPAAPSAKPFTSPTNGSEVRFHESW